MSEIGQPTQPSPTPLVTTTTLINYADLVKYVELANIVLMLIAGSTKILGSYLTYVDDLEYSITKVNPYATMLRMALLSAVTGVPNLMWSSFQFLGGVPSFVLETAATLIYLLEPSVGLLLTLFGLYVNVPRDRGFWLQTCGYTAEAITGILNVLKL